MKEQKWRVKLPILEVKNGMEEHLEPTKVKPITVPTLAPNFQPYSNLRATASPYHMKIE